MLEIKRYKRKRTYHGCLARIEKFVPRDHCLTSLCTASRCQTVTLGQIFLSAPHTSERFLYSTHHHHSYIILELGKQSSCLPGAVARSEASPLGMQVAPSSIPMSGTFFRGDLVMKTFLRPFSLFRWFKKSSCQLPVKECALSTGKLPRRLAQEQCG